MDNHQDTAIPQRKARLIVAQLLHRILRLGHGAFIELPFMQSAEILIILTAIFWHESEGKPLSALGLSEYLGMPRPTLGRRLSLLQSKEIIRQDTKGDGRGLRLNPQMFMTELRDESIRLLRQMIIDAGIELSKLDE